LLVLAALMLVTSVQCGFWARRHATRPDEMIAWWPTMPVSQRWRRIREEQWAEQAIHRIWAGRCRALYSAGITALWMGVAVAIVPDSPLSPARLATILVALAAAVGELVWSLAVHVQAHPVLGRVPGLRALERRLDRPMRELPSPPPERWPGPADDGHEHPYGG
jgi:hypothetical protein